MNRQMNRIVEIGSPAKCPYVAWSSDAYAAFCTHPQGPKYCYSGWANAYTLSFPDDCPLPVSKNKKVD